MSAGRWPAFLLAVWRVPAALALLSLFGLLAALLGEGGVWWLLAWSALAVPLAVIIACLGRGLRSAPRT
jgi:hypothetical protein